MENVIEPHITKLLPNTTQVPNIILDEWMPQLGDVEFRILMIVVRQTLGWVLDDASGRRKERDWISSSQLVLKSGKSRKHISKAVKALIEEHHLIEATNKNGELLDSAEKRGKSFGQIFYRLTLRMPQVSLFDKPRASKGLTNGAVRPFVSTQKGRTTKETHITKATLQTDESVALDNEKVKKQQKPHSDHHLFTVFFYEATKSSRGVKTIITGADGIMLKRILTSGVSRETLEQAATFFLSDRDFMQFSPTIKTFLSNGIITGILNRMQNEPEFWKKLDNYSQRRGILKALAGDPVKIAETTRNLMALRTALTKSLTMPRSS